MARIQQSHLAVFDEVSSMKQPSVQSLKNKFITHGVEKHLVERLVQTISDNSVSDSPSEASKALQEPPVTDLTPQAPVATPTTPLEDLKTGSEPLEEDLNASDEYERGYQDGQADLYEEYGLANQDGFHATNITMSASLGYSSKIYTIQVMTDSAADKALSWMLLPSHRRQPPSNPVTQN